LKFSAGRIFIVDYLGRRRGVALLCNVRDKKGMGFLRFCKRVLFLIVLILSLYSGYTAFAYAVFPNHEELVVFVNNSSIETDVPALRSLRTGRTFVPLRAVFENMGYTVAWNSSNRVVALFNGKHSIYFDTTGRTLEVEGKPIAYQTDWFMLKNNRILVPESLFTQIISMIDSDLRTHIVQPGDTLSSVSQIYFGTSNPTIWANIRESNGMMSDALMIGQEIIIPDPGERIILRVENQFVRITTHNLR